MIDRLKLSGIVAAGLLALQAVALASIIFEGGRATATFGIFTDLRERVRVEQQLAQAQEKLATSEKQALVAELAGATAHELNQPLTSVMGYAELLLRRLPEESQIRRGAEVIHREAERMAEIVRKIGKLTRYETKSYVGEQRILDLDRGSSDDGTSTGSGSGSGSGGAGSGQGGERGERGGQGGER